MLIFNILVIKICFSHIRVSAQYLSAAIQVHEIFAFHLSPFPAGY